MAKIEFPPQIEEIRTKIKMNKTDMKKLLTSFGELKSVDHYVVKLVEHVANSRQNVEASEKKFIGFHPISGEKVYR